jgi:hypothetical protein
MRTRHLRPAHALVPLVDAFRRRGVTVKGQPMTAELKVEVMSALKRTINMQRLQLPDHPTTVNQPGSRG